MEDCRIYHNQLIQGGKMHGISSHQRKEIERVISEEFLAGYAARFDCEACVNEMVILAFMFYDKYLTNEPSK